MPKSSVDRWVKNNHENENPISEASASYRMPQSQMILQNTPPENPNIKHMISFYIDQPSKLNVAENLFDYMKNQDNIRFNDRGDVLIPPIKTNILDVIQYLVLEKQRK